MDSDVIPMEGCNVEFVSPAKQRGVESHVTFAPGNQECLNILHQAKNGDNLRKLRKAFEKSTKKFNERFQTDSLTTKESAIILQSLAENGNMSFEFGIFRRKRKRRMQEEPEERQKEYQEPVKTIGIKFNVNTQKESGGKRDAQLKCVNCGFSFKGKESFDRHKQGKGCDCEIF